MKTDSVNHSFDINTIFGKSNSISAKERDIPVIDSDWVSSRFMVSDDELDKDIANIRYTSNASLKYVDTSIGGNIMMNPRPQFNYLTDPKADNMVMDYVKPTLDPNVKSEIGMGEGYSLLIDDNQQTVFMQFGMPKFNSLVDFFFRAVDYTDSVLANTGRPSTMYDIGKVVGTAVAFIAFPILAITVLAAKFILGALISGSTMKFYYFDSKMHMYWGTVNTLVTQLVTEQGLLAPMFMDSSSNPADSTKVGAPYKISQNDVENLNSMIDGIIDPETNYIDIFRIITRAQRAGMVRRKMIYKRMSENKLDNNSTIPINTLPELSVKDTVTNAITFGTYIKVITDTDSVKYGDKKPTTPKTAVPQAGPVSVGNDGDSRFYRAKINGEYIVKESAKNISSLQNTAQAIDASFRNGAAYAVFGVEYTGSTSESFSNSTTQISVGDQAKAIAHKSRELSYNLARGNVLGENVVTDVINGVKDLAMGALAGVSFNLTNIVAALDGNAYIEMPKRWDDSSMSFQQHTFKMSLISPYNTFLSQLQNIYVPLCMILAGVLPLSAGKSSYTSPYLCTSFSRGIQNIRLGMITSVNITRGTTNLAFDKKRNPLGIDVSFTVTDFSTLIASPVNSSLFTGLFSVNIEDDTPLGQYFSMLGNRDILTEKYRSKKVEMQLSRQLMRFEQTFNTDNLGVLLGDSLGSSVVGNLLSHGDLPNLYNK